MTNEETPIDISKIPPSTIKRLEEIVEGCEATDVKARFYKAVGNMDKAAKYGREMIKHQEQRIKEVSGADNAGSYKNMFEIAQQQGLSEKEQRKIAEKWFDGLVKEGEYDKAIEVGSKFLSLPQKQIDRLRESRLFDALMGKGCGGLYFATKDMCFISCSPGLDIVSFLGYVKKNGEGVEESRAKELAEDAYRTIMNSNDDKGLQVEFGDDCLQAGLIALEFNLGTDKINAAGRRLAERMCNQWKKRGYVMQNSQEVCELAVSELKLPKEITQKMMLPYFSGYLQRGQGKEKKEEYGLMEEDIAPVLQQHYSYDLKGGCFGGAASLRKKWAGLIQDNRVEISELEDLARIVDMQVWGFKG